MQRHRVGEVYFMSQSGKPARISAGCPADIGDDRGQRRQDSLDDFLCPGEL